jgi:hypothetical protein
MCLLTNISRNTEFLLSNRSVLSNHFWPRCICHLFQQPSNVLWGKPASELQLYLSCLENFDKLVASTMTSVDSVMYGSNEGLQRPQDRLELILEFFGVKLQMRDLKHQTHLQRRRSRVHISQFPKARSGEP